jgi:hypothetical protein
MDTAAIPVWHTGLPDGTHLVDCLSDAAFTVTDGALHLEGLTPGTGLILEAQ